MLNTMIGSSIFGLPSLIAAHLGKRSPAGYLVAFAGIAVIAACLAEVASQFQEAGGPYLYARSAFGPFVGIQIGWLTWLARISAASAVANLFISYLSTFVPAVKAPLARFVVIVTLLPFLAAMNYRGVSSGNRLSNLFTVTKLGLLAVFVIGGLAVLTLHPAIRVMPANVPASAGDWFDAIILSHIGESRRHRDTSGGLRAAIPWTPRRWVSSGGNFGLHLRVPQREHAAHSARHVRDGATWRVPESFRRDPSAVSHPLYFHRSFCCTADFVFGSRKFSVERDAFRRGSNVHVWLDCRGAPGAEKKATASGALSLARRSALRGACTAVQRGAGHANALG